MQYITQQMAVAMALLASAAAAPQPTISPKGSGRDYTASPTMQYSATAVNLAVAHTLVPARIMIEDHEGQVTNPHAAQSTIIALDIDAQDAAAGNALTVNVRNTLSQPLSLFYNHNDNSPAAKHVAGPHIAPGATSKTYPSGNIGIGHNFNLENSLVEFSYSGSQTSIDISFVDGFSVPIVCSCSGKVVTGCNKPLFQLHECGNTQSGPVCINPARPHDDGPAAPFFAPCKGKAFTFPDDYAAIGTCTTKTINCCVGTGCPANN